MHRLKLLKKPIYLISIPSYFLSFILPIYALKLGASAMEIGMLFSVFSLFSILMRPFVGKWIDKSGRKKGFIIGLIAFSLTRLLFLMGYNYTYIFIARIIQSIAASFFSISLDAMISDISSIEDRSKNFGEVSQYSNRGSFLGSFIGFNLLFSNIMEDPFRLIFGIYFIVSIVAIYFGVRDIEETIGTREIIQNSNVDINKTFIKYLWIIGILSLANGITAPIFIIYLKDHITQDLALITFMFIPSGILAMYLPSRLGKLADRYGRKKLMISGLLIEAILTMMIPFARDYYFFISIYTIIIASALMSVPAQRALVSEITGDKSRGRNYGLYHLALGLGGVIGPLIGSGIYEYINKDLVFYIEGLGFLATVVFIARYIKVDDNITNRDILEI